MCRDLGQALTPIEDHRPLDISIDLRMAVRKLQKSPLDLLTYNQEKFAEHAAQPNSFENVISTKGVTLYER